MRSIRFATFGVAALCAAAVLPAAASGDCTLPDSNNGDDPTYLSGGTTQTLTGHLEPTLNGEFIQIPFTVGDGIKGMKIRYCFAKAAGGGTDDNPTLDLGVYEAKPAGAIGWSQDERRGWSGSAVRTIGIGENGYTDAATYDAARKDYVPGYTTRAYEPGPIAAGRWAVELGAGWIDPDGAGVDWKVEVTTSTDPNWSDHPFVPDPYTPYVANPNPGWYTGDLHVHGEMEPGNATMTETFDLGFSALSAGGNGLDFLTLVDHNNDNARGILGREQYRYPGKLVIPGIEVTTYRGHANAQYSDYFADFRFSRIYRWVDANHDGVQVAAELSPVRGPIDPSTQLTKILSGGGFTQINHPDTARSAPAACRGCAWTYSDARTGWSEVSALEIQNGAAGFPANQANPPSTMNPFTPDAIATYERLLADGFHIAAVGSSDDHQAGHSTGITDGEVGRGATVVYARELSPDGIVKAVKAGHTYVKLFGADAPDVELSASVPNGARAIPGDSVAGSSLDIGIKVRGAGSAARPGPYTLKLLQDGIEVDSVPVTGDNFDYAKRVTETGRYSFELTRPFNETNTAIEAYSTPVWFTYEAPPVVRPSNSFKVHRYRALRRNGTAILRVRVASPGVFRLAGRGLRPAAARVRAKRQIVTLRVRPKPWLRKRLRRSGVVRPRVRMTNFPRHGRALRKTGRARLVLWKVVLRRHRLQQGRGRG